MEQTVGNKFFTSRMVFLFMLLFSASKCIAQQASRPILERTITIRFSNQRTDLVLNDISRLGGFSFSYNPSVINPEKIISGNFTNTPVREILLKIFGNSVDFREKKGYVILQKAKQTPPTPTTPPDNRVFSGYVRAEDGAPVTWASVYDRASLESTVSNDYGFYRIRFSSRHLPLTLFFSKQGYRDTSFFLQENSDVYLNVTLQKIQVDSISPVNYDSLSKVAESSVSAFFNGISQDQNISDTLYRKYQVSVWPYVGTNLKLSGNVINDYSFNIFGGLSMGTRKLELGGFFNLDKHDVSYMQVAGFSNLCGGNAKGVQLAGFTNIVRNKVSGVQISGFVNASFGDVEGLQIAGFVNSALDSMKGVQLSGFCNIAGNSMKGTQISGFCNVVIDTLRGTQLGFFNYTRYLQGSQIGFFNYSKNTSSVPVGFMSYVNGGYHKIEISADEIIPLNIAFRSGVNSFHNILTAGINPFTGDSLLWNFGYGIGTSGHISPKTMLELDLTASQIVENGKVEKINLVNKLYLGIDTKLAKKFSLAAGITVNGQLTNTNYDQYPDIFTWYEPHIFYDHTWELDNARLQMWFGGKVALRFL